MDTKDAEWLTAYAADGNAEAFARLVDRHAGWLVAAARRRLNDAQLAEDVAQSVFLLLAEKADQVVRADRASLAAWLFHAMHFTCCGLRRTRSRQARHETAAGAMPRDDSPVAGQQTIALLEDVIAELPPRDREAVVRRYYQREPFADIGRALGISAEAARKRVSRVLAQCRAAMAGGGVAAVEPETLLPQSVPWRDPAARTAALAAERHQTERITRQTLMKVGQMQAMQFVVMTAEFYVRSVEDHVAFFEKLGFRPHFIDALDANGLAPRASLRGGHTRIWLRRATPEHPTAPGVIVYLWLEGGEPAVIRHREAIAAQGVAVNQFFYDGTLMNFTVTSPDGYTIGFFSTYEPHTFDPARDG